MRAISLILFIFTLPVLAVLGHDLYITYQDEDFSKMLMLSDVGYLWRNYAPDSMEWAKDTLDKPTWDNFVVPILEQTSLVVAAIPLIITILIGMVLKIFEGSISFRRPKGKSFSFGSGDRKKGQFTYKRK